MPRNLSTFTEFGLFRNSNFVTAYEHVANSYIDTYIYIYIFICCAFAGNSYQESKPGKEKHKSEVARNNVNIRITVSTWLGIPLNKYLETDGTIIIHNKVLFLWREQCSWASRFSALRLSTRAIVRPWRSQIFPMSLQY